MIKMILSLTNDEKSRKAAEFLWKYGMSIRQRQIRYISNGNTQGSTSDTSKHYECVADLESLRIVVWQNVQRSSGVISLLPSLYKNNKIRRDAWHLIFSFFFFLFYYFRRASASLSNVVVTDPIDPRLIRIYCHVTKSSMMAFMRT